MGLKNNLLLAAIVSFTLPFQSLASDTKDTERSGGTENSSGTEHDHSHHATADTGPPWQKVRDNDGIQVYLRDVPGSAIREFKGIAVIDSSLDSLAGVLNDISSCRQWVHLCESPMIIRNLGFSERYAYQVSDFPFPAHNRDVIHHATIEQHPSRRGILVRLKAAPDYCIGQSLPGCEAINRSTYIRIRHSHGSYHLEPINATRTRVTWQQHVDPGGHLPNWMVNSMLVDVPFKTLKKLAKVVKQEKYRSAKLAYNTEGIAVGFEVKGW